MAYDPKDPKDKEIVDKLIADALEEAQEKHESEIDGLKAKNVDLINKNKKLKEGKADLELVQKLEDENEKLSTENADLKKATAKLTKEHEAQKKRADTEEAASRKFLIDTGLTEALVGVNVGPQFLPAVKKLLADQLTIKVDGENRSVMAGDKPLGEFVKAWSQGDGKHYIVAPANGGGNSQGGQAGAGGSGKQLTRTAFDKLSQLERATFAKEGGKIVEG